MSNRFQIQERSEDAILDAVAVVIKEQMAQLAPSVRSTATIPSVNLSDGTVTPTINVVIDMKPVADALDRLAKILGSVLRDMASADTSAPTIELNPVINVEQPAITVQAAQVPQRSKRRLKITHDDGTSTVVQKE